MKDEEIIVDVTGNSAWMSLTAYERIKTWLRRHGVQVRESRRVGERSLHLAEPAAKKPARRARKPAAKRAGR